MKFKSKLHFVRIFFDTSTFDKVTRVSKLIMINSFFSSKIKYTNIKDQKAKDVDKLSAIGGTLGLLTGFSIISGVEVLFFILKIVHNLVQQKLVNWKITAN